MGKKNVHKLTEQDLSLTLLGISSHENDYRISWAFNEHLNLHFKKTENHSFLHPKLAITLEFSQYLHEDQEAHSLFRLISNRCENGFLLEEYKNIDFFLLLDTQDKEIVQSLIQGVKAIPFVSMIFTIDLSSLKNKNRLF